MFDYEFNKKTKHTMIVGCLTYLHYKMNIVYEDYGGWYVKCMITTNICDFYANSLERQNMKNAFKDWLEECFQMYSVPENIQKNIMQKHKRLV